jgi:hypothetical protein
MTFDIAIWQSAFSLVEQHGEDAESVAVHQVDEFAERDDREGYVLWTLIQRAVFELEAMSADPRTDRPETVAAATVA